MESDIFFENFGCLVDATESIPRLREMILQLAVQGKLVEQDSNDEPASVLLEKIRVEKERLVKEGKIRKKKILPPISDDEIPYELPEGWAWTYLGRIIELTSGQHIKKHNYNTDSRGVSYLTGPVDFGEKYPIIAKWTEKPKVIAHKNDILLTVKGAGLGKNNLVDIDEIAISRQLMAITSILVDFYYIHFFVKSKYQYFQNAGVGIAIPGMGRDDVLFMKIPLPPLTEQHRIVVKVDKLMSLCDQLEAQKHQATNDRRKLNTAAIHELLKPQDPGEFEKKWQFIHGNFQLLYNDPENVKELRQAILQLAVMGKLVEQNTDDEPAGVLLEKIKKRKKDLIEKGKLVKHRKTRKIEEEKIPFSIPSNWVWVRLEEISQITDRDHRTPKYMTDGIPLISPRCFTPNGISFYDLKNVTNQEYQDFIRKCNPQMNDLLYVRIGSTTGRVRIINFEMNFVALHSLALIKPIRPYIFPYWLLYQMKSGNVYSQARGGVQSMGVPDLGLKKMANILIALPPLAEQHRIVAKVDKLTSLCDQLEAKIDQSQDHSVQLLNAVVHEMLAG